MGDAAGEDEDVPGGVEVAAAVEGEEDDAQRVGEAACAQPGEAVPANGVDSGTDREDDEPSLQKIDHGRENGEPPLLEPLHGEALEEDAGDGQRPLHREDRPAQRATQRDEREGGVGAGDEQVDGGVVEDVEDGARASADQRVIERGAEVNEDERGGKDGATDDVPGRTARGSDDEVDGAGDGESCADAVGDGVGEDVAQVIDVQICGVGHRLMIVRDE